MFNVFPLLLDDAFKPVTPLTVINETLQQSLEISHGTVAT